MSLLSVSGTESTHVASSRSKASLISPDTALDDAVSLRYVGFPSA